MAAPLVVLPDTPPATPGRLDPPSAFAHKPALPHTPPETPPTTDLDVSLAHWDDWSLDRPLATLLREASALAHEQVQRAPVVDMLVRGEIPKELHVRYLVMLYHVYSTLERALAVHSADPVLAPIHNAALLNRSDALASDIATFTGDAHWRSSALAERGEALASTELASYVARLGALAEEAPYATPAGAVYPPAESKAYLLLAHAYVRYMGDLSGGQTIARAVEAAYGLERDSMAFYRFGTLDDADATAGPSEMKRIKAWFRQGMDLAGSHLTERQKAAMMQEANFAFELNVRLFSSFAKDLDLAPEAPAIGLATRNAHSKASTYSAGLSKRPGLSTERRSSCPFHVAQLPLATTSTSTRQYVLVAGVALVVAVLLAMRTA